MVDVDYDEYSRCEKLYNISLGILRPYLTLPYLTLPYRGTGPHTKVRYSKYRSATLFDNLLGLPSLSCDTLPYFMTETSLSLPISFVETNIAFRPCPSLQMKAHQPYLHLESRIAATA